MIAEVDVGRLIAGKYQLVRLIGKGAMGEVWLATHTSLGGEFAIKLVQPSDDEEDETAAGRFQLEAQVSAKLSRKTRHIVSVSDHGEEHGLAYLVMELLEGESLEARIKRVGPMDLAETVAIVMQVARALGQAHAEHIFHRDLKPANIFLIKDEDGRLLVKLLDFGIARTTKPMKTRTPFATGKDMVLGTPSYMSPEQARGLDSLDHRCDLWALAVVAYEALCHRIPWEGETVEDIFLSICTFRMTPILSRRSDLPPAIEGVFARSFAPKLDARFHDAAELSEAFEALVDPGAVEAAMGGRPSSRNLLTAIATPQAMKPYQVTGPTEPALSPRERGSDPVGLSLGESSRSIPKRRSAGWIVAAISAVVTLVLLFVGVSVFSSRQKATATTAPISSPPVVAPSVDRTNVPPPESAKPPEVTPPPVVTRTPSPPVRVVAQAPVHSAPTSAPTPPVVAPAETKAPARVHHVPAPVVSAAPPKSPDKGEVF